MRQMVRTDADERYISQSACLEDAKAVAALVEEYFPHLKGKVEINEHRHDNRQSVQARGQLLCSSGGRGAKDSRFCFGERKRMKLRKCERSM